MRALRRLLPVVIALVVAVGLVLRAGEDDTLPPSHATVVRAVDGDTIVVRLPSGTEERVRYVGIDTPESVKPGTPVQCFAKAASDANAALVEGRRVRLVRDVSERDRYGRLLAYVYRDDDDLLVNEELVRQGYAHATPYPPDVRYESRFRTLEREAREASRGLWKAC
ncbi:MAG: thermonuclease family protein [Solirubrobacteraceae bacterium]